MVTHGPKINGYDTEGGCLEVYNLWPEFATFKVELSDCNREVASLYTVTPLLQYHTQVCLYDNFYSTELPDLLA